LLACDGGRSAIRTSLGVQVEGHTLDVRYMLVDVRVDLDTLNPRDYPYLAYFSDPQEWMILVRQPHCWRFLFPIAPGVEQLEADELREKVTHFVGSVSDMEILNTITYRVHHRIASQWRSGNVFLMGDAAHLITPMWALGMNTGVLDSLSLPWRLAWVLRGWAPSSLLDGYEAEQRPLAAYGSGEMAEAARKIMGGAKDMESGDQMSDWALAMTRCLLAVKVDVDGKSDWSIVRKSKLPMTTGERIPDFTLFAGEGRSVRLHDLVDDSFVALHFTDARRRIALPDDEPGLRNFIVSRWDAPLDSGLRDRSLLDVGNMLFERIGCPENTIVLVRPDDHVAAIKPIAGNDARALYSNALGRQQ
jgi:3-(3-hydroxy-phenyl)propionate hydroxylase